jgi:hypothetical protein
MIWAERQDWFFAVDMGIYTREGQMTRTAIVPDAFLSLGVPRSKGEQGRLSYVLAEENQVAPILVLEVVSQTYGGEYDEKMRIYAEMGIRYTVIFNPHHWRRDKRDPLEVYELQDNQYQRLPGNPVWLEGVALGIGVERREVTQWQRDWLYWYNREGERYPTPEEIIAQERMRAEQSGQQAEQERIRAERERLLKEQASQQIEQERMRAEQANQQVERERRRAERLAAKLRQLGLDPNDEE